MESILFIGSHTHGYFAEEVAKTRGYAYHQIDAGADIRKMTNDILTYVHKEQLSVSIIVYDVDVFINDAKEIAAEIYGTANTINARPVVYMPSFLPESEMAKALLAKDIKSYVFSGSASSLKDQLEKNITGYFEANGRKEIEEAVRLQEEARAHISVYKTIGVAGTQERIGTTTQAIQIVKYLQYKGYTACYLELNQNRYFDMSGRDGSVRELGFVDKYKLWTMTEDSSNVIYKGVDMYRAEQLTSVQKMEYDYYVYDYGNIFDRDFDRMAYLKDDIQLIVGGAKPQEFDFLEKLMCLPAYANASIILSFVPDGDRDTVLKTISDLKSWSGTDEARPVIFAEYTPDPFLFTNAAEYERLVPVEMTEQARADQEQAEQKKKKLFRKRGTKR